MEILGISLTTLDIYLLGACGVLLMALVYPRVNDWQHKRGRLRDAVHTYKSAFSDSLAALSNNSNALDTVANDFERHKAAVDDIRPILPKYYQWKLQKAWDKYRGKGNDGGFNDKEYIAMSSAFLWTWANKFHRQQAEAFNTTLLPSLN